MKFTEVIGKMIDLDIENGSRSVLRCDSVVGAKKNKKGGVIEMGVPDDIVIDMAMNPTPKYTPILLLIETKVFEQINKPNN